MSFHVPRGTSDVLPEQSPIWQYIEQQAVSISRTYNYNEIRTPIFEHTELFHRGVGETTDIVEKEMYTFKDKGDRNITLRPEGTAAVVRSYVENKMHGYAQQPVKLFYLGPMFRYERPQAGRTRQFTQFGVEAIGSEDPAIDAEVISMAMSFFQNLGLKDLSVEINSVGCSVCRPKHREALLEYLLKVQDQLGEEDRHRIERNPLRVLDSKDPKTQELTEDAPSILQYLCEDCRPHFERLKDYLTQLGVPYDVNPRMVRGLDYYTQTAFEIKAKGMSANDTICGGGRYNGLVEEIGGPQVAGIGFALSMERILVALQSQSIELPVDQSLDYYFVFLGKQAKLKGTAYMQELRKAGLRCDMDYLNRGMKGQMKSADRMMARYVMIMGDDEIEKGVVVLKRMDTGQQTEAPFSEVKEMILQSL